MELQVFILSKISQTQKEKKDHLPIFPSMRKTHKSDRKVERGLCEERGEPKGRKGSEEDNRGRRTHDFMFYLIHMQNLDFTYIVCLSPITHISVCMHVCVSQNWKGSILDEEGTSRMGVGQIYNDRYM